MIINKFSSEELDQLILHCLTNYKSSIFLSIHAHEGIFSKKKTDEIGVMLNFIGDYDNTIVKKYPKDKGDYYSSYSVGPFAESFVNTGGFKKVFEENAIKEKETIELKRLEKESLKAAPKAVKTANNANKISIVAMIITIVFTFIQMKISYNDGKKLEVIQKQIDNIQIHSKILKDSIDILQQRIKIINSINKSKSNNK